MWRPTYEYIARRIKLTAAVLKALDATIRLVGSKFAAFIATRPAFDAASFEPLWTPFVIGTGRLWPAFDAASFEPLWPKNQSEIDDEDIKFMDSYSSITSK